MPTGNYSKRLAEIRQGPVVAETDGSVVAMQLPISLPAKADWWQASFVRVPQTALAC